MSEKSKGGRPYKKIDWETVDKLCSLHCTGEEIAGFLSISYDTLERAIKRVHGVSFADYYRQKAANGKVSLRRRQFKMSESNVAMAIWLGKNWLGQSDSQDVKSYHEVKLKYKLDTDD